MKRKVGFDGDRRQHMVKDVSYIEVAFLEDTTIL